MSLDDIIGSFQDPGEPFFVCTFCGDPLDTDTPTTVRVVEVKDGRDGLHDLMHASCWPGDGHGWRRVLEADESTLDIYARAAEIRAGIVDPAFQAELDQDVMALREGCKRAGQTVDQVAEEIFRASDADPDSDSWLHAEAVVAWALLEWHTIE